MNQMNMSEQYIGHIDRLCCAADSKNWTDSNSCYGTAEGTMQWYRMGRGGYWG
jgi:hypothetical protein